MSSVIKSRVFLIIWRQNKGFWVISQDDSFRPGLFLFSPSQTRNPRQKTLDIAADKFAYISIITLLELYKESKKYKTQQKTRELAGEGGFISN